MSTNRKICAVIVTYEGAPWIRRCLESLESSSVGVQAIVVDNASSDDTVAIVEREFPSADVIRMSTNTGFGVGNNAGIARAFELGMDQVLLLNQDAHVETDTVAQLSGFLDSNPAFGVVSPLHCSPGPDSIDRKSLTYYLQPHAPTYLSDACIGRVQPHYSIRGINAAAWLVRSEVFRHTGGFDPLFFMYGEDDDLLNRFALHRIGFALLPAARIVHLRQSPTPATPAPPTRARRIERTAVRLRSQWLVEIKNASFGPVYMALHLLARGLVEPLATLLIDRKLDDFRAALLAAARLAAEIPKVRRHAALCATPGPHFLTPSETTPRPTTLEARPDVASARHGG